MDYWFTGLVLDAGTIQMEPSPRCHMSWSVWTSWQSVGKFYVANSNGRKVPLQGGSQQIKKPFYSVLLKKKNRTQARYGLHDLGPVPGTGILLDAISLLNLYRVTDLPTALSPVAIPVSQYKVPTVSSNKTKTVVYKRFTAGLPPLNITHFQTSFYCSHWSGKTGNKLQIFLPNLLMTQSQQLYIH